MYNVLTLFSFIKCKFHSYAVAADFPPLAQHPPSGCPGQWRSQGGGEGGRQKKKEEKERTEKKKGKRKRKKERHKERESE